MSTRQKVIICFIFFLSFTSLAYSNFGLLADFNINGISIGQTKLKGNLKVQLKPDLKRIIGDIFYQEPGNPFPELDEKDVIINFKTGKKYLFTSSSEQWLTSSIDDDYSMLDEKNVKITVVKKPKVITTTIIMKQPPEFGGNQKYIIKFKYKSIKLSEEDNAVKKYKNPTAIDILSIFIDNEELIKLINNKLPKNNFRIPDIFSIVWYQGSKVHLNVTGSLSVKMIINMYNEDFKPVRL